MRYVFWKNHKSFVRNLIFFIMGIYTGFFFFLYLHGKQIDDLMKINDRLTVELKNCKNENETLKQERKQRQQNQLIRIIKFHYDDQLDPFIETELLEKLMDETQFLIGKKIEDVKKSPDFIFQLLNQRIYKIKEKNYQINVKFVSIQSTTEIWIVIREHKKE
ncbi:hypothetical protein BHF71_06390 [Vulcanibacillus modesticaldus]|uniref:Sporulation membrane protein YtrI C-terminal domain-containing protein n=1 Tax=Vulcanibacillus modesticaldus TaxID=337097 RepID=A0A1D2YWE5_9BACI|nr:hypothetical protein [Vulcanibacillus modesticaldus]OEG00071.1 hypothetical protein BHF71_06390 [Vulcanibacillus modesticaldus]